MCVYIHFIPNNLWISITGMHFMSVLYFRAEKSEVLSEDLQTVEKRVELVKTVCQSTSKKIAGCLQGQGTDYEKRLVQCDCYLKLKPDTPLISGPHVKLWYFFVIVEKVTWEYSWSWDDRSIFQKVSTRTILPVHLYMLFSYIISSIDKGKERFRPNLFLFRILVIGT